jgi:hypothetical protein
MHRKHRMRITRTFLFSLLLLCAYCADMKQVKKKTNKVSRNRKSYSITLSEEAHSKGVALAQRRGLQFAPFVETLIRAELRAVGMLPPESEAVMHEE